MAKNVLPVDFQDDILAESMNGRRKYQMITNSDGTVSFVDVTEYTQVGSNFGQAQVNATNEAVNESADKNKIIDDKDDLVANSQAGMMAGALAVKAIREELTQKIPGLTIKPLKAISDLDEVSPNSTFRICWGIFDNNAYVSFDISWTRLQFWVDSSNILCRYKYGNNDAGEWNIL